MYLYILEKLLYLNHCEVCTKMNGGGYARLILWIAWGKAWYTC